MLRGDDGDALPQVYPVALRLVVAANDHALLGSPLQGVLSWVLSYVARRSKHHDVPHTRHRMSEHLERRCALCVLARRTPIEYIGSVLDRIAPKMQR